MKKCAYLLITFLLIGCGSDSVDGDATNGAAPITEVPYETSVSTNGATLNGKIIANGLLTNAWFEYGIDPSLTTYSSTPQQSIGSGMIAEPVSYPITGLAENTKYYFRERASNAKGETQSAIISFTTSSPGAAPAVTTLAATSVAQTRQP